MSSSSAPSRRWTFFVLVGLVPFWVFSTKGGIGVEPKSEPEQAKVGRALIDAIANSNKPSTVFDRTPKKEMTREEARALRPRKVPLYPEKYDWVEEARVRK